MSNLEFKYFYEDEVFRTNKRGTLQFGMVVENAEFASSDEDDDEDEEPVKKGHVRVAWYPSGTEEIVPEKKIYLADRSLMPGDVVRRMVKGRDTQRGYCRNINVFASVQIMGTKQVIFGVESKDLTPLEQFTSDVLVCLDGWVGMIRTVNSKLTVRFSDGSKVILDDSVAEDLEDIRDKRDPECEFKRYDFYPGQVLFGGIRMMEEGKWLECSKELVNNRKNKPHKGYKVTVEDIDFSSIGVSWTCRAYSGSDSQDDLLKSQQQPKYLVEGEDLKRVKMLNVFEPCTLQIGDRNFYTIKENDILMMKTEWKKLQKDTLMKGKKETIKVKTKKDVVEVDTVAGADDGNSSDYEDMDSGGHESDAVSVSSADSHSQPIDGKIVKKKNRGQPALMTKVLKKKKLKKTKRATVNEDVNPLIKPGDRVVVETLSTKSEADVVWQDGSVEPTVDSSNLYPIHHLDDHEFFPGDFVVEAVDGFHPHSYGVVQEVDHQGRCAKVKWFKTYTAGNQPQPLFLSNADVSVYDLKDHPDFKYRPASIVIRVANYETAGCGMGAGQVLDNHPSGQVSVWWAGPGEGSTVTCWPQDLYKVGEYDSDEGDLWAESEEDDSDNESWATESEHSVPEEEAVEEENDLKPKLAANIEKARIAMARLEEIFKDNPTLQTAGVMKQLLDVYKDCRYLDRLMGTEFFHEKHFQGFLERIRDQGRISTVEQAVQEQVTRLFSADESMNEAKSPIKQSEDEVFKSLEGTPSPVKACASPSPGRDSGNGSFVDKDAKSRDEKKDGEVEEKNLERDEIPASQVCAKLCHLIKSQLVKCHEEVVVRFGGEAVSAEVLKTTLEGDNDDEDLDQMVSRGLRALNFIPFVDASKPTKNVPLAEAEIVNDSLDDISADQNNDGSKTKTMTEELNEAIVKAGQLEEWVEVIRQKNEEVETLKNKMKVLEQGTDSITSTSADTKKTSKDSPKEAEQFNVNENLPKEGLTPKKSLDGACALPSVPEDSKLPDGAGSLNDSLPCAGAGSLNDSLPCSSTIPLSPGSFETVETVPVNHKFKLTMFQPSDMKSFVRFVRREIKLLRTALPPGIRVRGFDDRMDLYSACIEGPKNTPYENGLFFFDFQLGPDYPSVPPTCHYISYCSDRLNPNLYEDGKVCVSLLGTWSGKGTETWTPNSNLLQLLVSIQGLILVNEPYFNEAGYERQKGTQQGRENSRMYNEMALLKLVQSMNRLIQNTPEIFKEEIQEHFQNHAGSLISRLEKWRSISVCHNTQHPTSPTTPGTFASSSNLSLDLPEFPLIPASKGFCITLEKTLQSFKKSALAAGINLD